MNTKDCIFSNWLIHAKQRVQFLSAPIVSGSNYLLTMRWHKWYKNVNLSYVTHLLWRKFKSQKILYNFWHWFLALFTKPIKNWGVPEMIYCKFLPWSKNCRWNRVKMVKNVPKMAEIILGTSHMIDNKIFNIFSFFNFFLWILFRPCFLEFFLKILTNYRGSTVPKRKSWKTKKR